VRLWDPTTGEQQAELTGHTDWVNALAALPGPDGRTLLASSGEDGTVRLWDPTTGEQQAELTGHTGGVNAVAALPGPDGRTLLASGGDDGTVRLWDPTTGVELVRVAMGAPISSLAVSPAASDPSSGSGLVVGGVLGLALFDVPGSHPTR
jgi:WD40 repeat protein